MKAVVFDRNGGPEVLDFKETAEPTPQDGEVLVEVKAVGVNFRDLYEREGHYGAKPPALVGVEGAGVVSGTSERVAWLDVPNSYAERVAARRDKLVPVPDGIETDIAAAALLQGITAHYLATESHPVQKGDWVVVHSAAGGVGRLLTQIVKLRGGKVIATTSTEQKAKVAVEVGADEVLRYEGFAQRAREITQGAGVAAVFDGVGKTTFYEGLTAIKPFGRMILYGSSSGQPEPLQVQSLAGYGSLYVQRPSLQTYTRTADMLRERARNVFELILKGELDVRIGASYPLGNARQAHIDLQTRKTTGKLLLLP